MQGDDVGDLGILIGVKIAGAGSNGVCKTHETDRLFSSKVGFHLSPSLERTTLGSPVGLNVQYHKGSLEVRTSQTVSSTYLDRLRSD